MVTINRLKQWHCLLSILSLRHYEAIIVHALVSSTKDPKLLPAPPMGCKNWARFECNLNETLFTDTAQATVSRGLLDAGYNRLNLADCWMTHDRAADGSLQWNCTKFPHGIPWLAQDAKNHGFLLGIYEDAGNATCGGFPGSYGHEQQDAETFASWGIDYLKLDGCNVYAEDGRSFAGRVPPSVRPVAQDLKRLVAAADILRVCACVLLYQCQRLGQGHRLGSLLRSAGASFG